jgi:putative transposase
MLRAFKYRLCPNQRLEERRWLSNHMLAERSDAWERRQESPRYYDQVMSQPALKAERPALAGARSQVSQNVAARVDLAFKARFRRAKVSEAPGYPRFRGKGRYGSVTSPQAPSGCKLDADGKRLRLQGVGPVKIVLRRPLEGTPRTATVRSSSTGKWDACFSCEPPEPSLLPATGRQVGIAVGLRNFATLSTGRHIANPRFFRAEEKAFAMAQRARSKLEKGAPEQAKHQHAVARVRERIAWRRSDLAHQRSRCIADGDDRIAVEDVPVSRVTHHHCRAKSIHDAAWSQCASLFSYKAAWAGRRGVAVNFADRTSPCSCCGVVLDRDHNAAMNILALERQCLASA